MKKIPYLVILISTILGCKSLQNTSEVSQPTVANLDLVNVQNDKVEVVIDPARFTSETTTFYIPKTVPGTYSEDNYGRFIEDFKALDYEGKEIQFTAVDENSWLIPNAENLDKVSYWVNDTYDTQGEGGVFSPSGTNIMENQNFMLNLHGFVGYFDGLEEQQYRLEIKRPENLIPGTALTLYDTSESQEQEKTDIFLLDRYFQVTDNPIMYALPDTTAFSVEGMKVLVDVYSPNKVYSSEDITPGIKEMIAAQKRFLGDIDNTDKYAILLYLAQAGQQDATGMGALEHHTSTVVVLPESMPKPALQKTMTDVVSHEFFHILTPLNVHSQEIHYFDYNAPEMSEHLWMYEGVTEYFANLFQVNQGLIEEEDFYGRMTGKIETSMNFDDTMPFTVMSRNILEEEYAKSYYNVYQKGALIGMALDIRLRELSNGEMGILDVMKKLSEKNGKDRPFQDEQLFKDIVALSYPEIETFFEKYVSGTTPIPYDEFFNKVGLELTEEEVNTSYFLKGQTPYVDINSETGELFFRENITFNSFLDELGVEGGDIIKSINGTAVNQENAYNIIMSSLSWEPGTEVTIVVERNDEEITLAETAFQPQDKELKLVDQSLDESNSKVQLRRSWLKD